MKLKTGMLLGAIVAAGASMSVLAGKDDKVDLCHVTGNGDVVAITVSESAALAHLAHGDTLPVNGVCHSGGGGPR